MKMKKYNTPEIEIQGFSFEDVITTSGERIGFGGDGTSGTYSENRLSMYDYFN